MGLDGNAPRQRRGEDAPRAEDTEEEVKQADAQTPLIAQFRTMGANLISQIAERAATLITVGGEDTEAETRSLLQSIAIWAKAAALLLSVGVLIGFLGSGGGLRGGGDPSSTAVAMMQPRRRPDDFGAPNALDAVLGEDASEAIEDRDAADAEKEWLRERLVAEGGGTGGGASEQAAATQRRLDALTARAALPPQPAATARAGALPWMRAAEEVQACKRSVQATYRQMKGCYKRCKFQRIRAAQACTPNPGRRIDVVPFPATVAAFKAFERAGKPVVFAGMFPKLEASPWTFETVRERIGNVKFSVRFGEYAKLRTRKHSKMKMSEYIDRYLTAKVHKKAAEHARGLPPYIGNNVLSERVARMLGLEYPPYYAKDKFHQPAMWFGKKGSLTPLHKDGADNFCTLFIGSKRFLLFSPTEAEKIYYAREPDDTLNWSRLAAIKAEQLAEAHSRRLAGEAPELFARWPKLADAEYSVADVHAGQVLYLPAGWAHAVDNFEDTLMINFWLANRRMVLGDH